MAKHQISFCQPIYQPQTLQLRNTIANILTRDDVESLTILFSSEGGSTDESLSLYNFIQSLKAPIHMHGMGHIGSAAIPVFLAGQKRTCSPYSRFFFHAYDWGFEGRQMADRIEEALSRLKSDIKIASEIAIKHTSIPKETILKLYDKNSVPTIYEPEEAKKLGIVENVLELNPKGEIQKGTVLWTI